MKIPYNQVHTNGDIIFAARSGQIQTFSLQDGHLISTWKHPDVEKVAEAVKEVAAEETIDAVMEESKEDAPQEDDDAPPAKRQKTADAEDVSASKTSEKAEDQKNSENAKSKKGKGKKGGHVDGKGRGKSYVPDRPIVTHLTTTADGKHLLAVTGHDKTVWVFDHDGSGNISQASQRVMPKRPSAVAIGPDSQIICADKFGDVYSLPLIPDASYVAPASVAAPKPKTFSEANTFTVHSQRNLKSLQSQKEQWEKEQATGETVEKLAGPSFELHLQLGHVSMLTDMVLGEREGKNYIITADRDEHVRVSRYLPQAHVIETYCMGHKDFVGALVIPPSQGNVLVSGGGDSELFVWDWLAGRRLSKASVLKLAQEISPETSKVAVSNLYSLVYPTESGNLTYILAICEDVKAIFSWQLAEDNVLNHPGVIQLPGNPLALNIIATEGASPKILAAIDPVSDAPIKSLNLFTLTMNEGRLAVDTTSHVEEEAAEGTDLEATQEEIRNLLYGVENLRKVKESEEGEDEGEGVVSEAAASEN